MSTKVNLLICESSGKVATISNILSTEEIRSKYGTFVVLPCFGHIQDLPKKELGIDINNNFLPHYERLAEKAAAVNKIKTAAKKASTIYIASDDDYDGTFIAESIRTVLNLGENYKRIVFTEITDDAIKYALDHPTKIDQLALASQQCRRTLDRLVGFKLSPLLWKKFNSGIIRLSAGRVQSALLHLIIQHENEIIDFKSIPYWHVAGNFELEVGKEKSSLENVNMYLDTTIYKTEQETDIQQLFKQLKNDWKIIKYTKSLSRKNPDPPFITSSLQQEASSQFQLGIKRVMAVAQELYEAGYITYIRTDSYNMSTTFKAKAREFIVKKYGNDYLNDKEKTVKKNASAQEAHECIRPTNVDRLEIPAKYDKDHHAIYKLIWQRSVAYLMKPAIYDELKLVIRDDGMPENMSFNTSFKHIQFNGYLVVYNTEISKYNFDYIINAIQTHKYNLKATQLQGINTWTSHPAHYNDSGLVKLMEKSNIGRPSTFSTIIQKLYDKNYIIKTDIQGTERQLTHYTFDPKKKKLTKETLTALIGAESFKIKPTEIGFEIDKYLEDHFGYIVDTSFTADMETSIDLISNGKQTRVQVLEKFWKKFSKDLSKQENMKEGKIKITAEQREVIIQDQKYIVRLGLYGPLIEYIVNGEKKFIGLKGYLGFVKKEYMDIDESDIKLLLEHPKVIGTYNNTGVALHFGPYGPYLRWNNKNIKVPRFASKLFLQTKTLTPEQVESFINYSLSDNDGKSKKDKSGKVKRPTAKKSPRKQKL